MRSSKTESYVEALKAPRVDSSDFILLTTGILKEQLGDKIQQDIQKIQNLYIHNETGNAINAVLDIFKNQIKDNAPLVNLVQEKAKSCVGVDNPMKNDSRRFFETEYSNQVWKNLGKPEFDSMNKLLAFIKEIHPVFLPAQKPPETIQSSNDVDATMESMHELTFNDVAVEKHEHEIREASEHSRSKDRGGKKRSEYMIEDAKGEMVKDTPKLSRNPGIMKALSPNPMDNLTSEQKNRLPDNFNIDPKHAGYSTTHRDVPFVNSVSGHTYLLTALLDKYLEKHIDEYKGQSDVLHNDINNMAIILTASKILKGFHSLAEMADVLKEPVVKKIYSDHGVDLNLSFSTEIVNRACERARDYATKICLQRAINEQIPVEAKKSSMAKIFTSLPSTMESTRSPAAVLRTSDEKKSEDIPTANMNVSVTNAPEAPVNANREEKEKIVSSGNIGIKSKS